MLFEPDKMSLTTDLIAKLKENVTQRVDPLQSVNSFVNLDKIRNIKVNLGQIREIDVTAAIRDKIGAVSKSTELVLVHIDRFPKGEKQRTVTTFESNLILLDSQNSPQKFILTCLVCHLDQEGFQVFQVDEPFIDFEEYERSAYLLVYTHHQRAISVTPSEKQKSPVQQAKDASQDVLFKRYFSHFSSKLVKDGSISKDDVSKWLKMLAENTVTSGWSFVRLTEKDLAEMNFSIGQRKILVKIQHKFLALQRAQAKAAQSESDPDPPNNTNVPTHNTTNDHIMANIDERKAQISSGIQSTAGQRLVKVRNSLSNLPAASSSPNERASSIIGNLKFILNKFRAGLVEREQHCSLMLLSLLCGEHSLLLGPPGVAKSQLCSRITSLISRNEKMFSRLLTKFTLPEELFGPLSIQDLKLDRHNRITKGYLPEARVAFLDEIFKANSAILNSMLTVLNERKFDNGTTRHDIPLLIAVAASNEYPANTGELQALYDRFLFRMWVDPVTSFTGFRDLINPLNVISNNVEIPEAFLFTPEALAVIRQESQTKELDEGVFFLLHNVMTQLDKKKIYVSPRRWIKIRQVVQMVAHTSEVRRPLCLSDCAILKHLTWNRHTQINDIWEVFLQALSTTLQLFPEHIDTVIQNCNNHFWISPQECEDIKRVCNGLQKVPRITQAPHPTKHDSSGKTFVNESVFSTRAWTQQVGFVPSEVTVRNFLTSQSTVISNYLLVGVKQQQCWHKVAVHIDHINSVISARVLSPIFHPHVSADGVIYCLEIAEGIDLQAKLKKFLFDLKEHLTNPKNGHLEIMKNMSSSPLASDAATILLRDPKLFKTKVEEFNNIHQADLLPITDKDLITNKRY